MYSANRTLVKFLPPMLDFPSCSSRALFIIRTRKMLKKVGKRRHPYPTPAIVLNHSPTLLFICTCNLVIELLGGAKYICTDIVLPHGGP